MKRVFSVFLCMMLIVFVAGCKKPKTPEEIEQQITAQLGDIKYLDAQVLGKITMQTGNSPAVAVTADANYKLDASTDFPTMSLKGTLGVEGIGSMPVSLYLNENGGTIEALGQINSFPVDEDTKSQIQNMDRTSFTNNINRTVTETTYGENRAIQVTYDTNALNAQLQGTDSSFDSLIIYYLINENDELLSTVTTVSLSAQNFKTEINMDIKFNSINEPLTIEPVSVTKQTVILGQTEL